VELDDFVALTSYLHNEKDLVVWQGLSSFLEKLSKLLSLSDAYKNFASYFGTKATKALQLFESTTNSKELEIGAKAILRSILMQLSCRFGDKNCIQQSQHLFNDLNINTKHNEIALSLQTAVFCTSVTHDSNGILSNKILTTLESIYDDSFSPLRSRLLNSLTCSQNISILNRLAVELLKTDDRRSYIRETEKSDVAINLLDNPLGKEMLMKQLMNSPSEIFNLFKSNEDLRIFLDKLTSYNLSDSEIQIIINAAETMPMNSRQIVNQAIFTARQNQEIYKTISIPLQNILC